MSSSTATRPRLSRHARWAVPAVAAVALAGALIAPPLLAAADGSGLPEVTAEELVHSVAEAGPVPMSGTIVYTARLGLPDVAMDEITGADPLGLLSGSSTLRMWTDGADRSRVALLGSTSEYSVVRDGPQAWTYSSAKDEATHYFLNVEDQARYDDLATDMADGSLPEGAGELPTPADAADHALEHVEEFSTLTVSDPVAVAGRDAYQLLITPDSEQTLIDRVAVAIDAETSVPLRVQVWSTQDGEAPAWEIAFTDVDFEAPDESVLTFSAPAGAQVREVPVPLPEGGSATDHDGDGVTVVGSGWESVAVFEDVDVAGLLTGDPAAVGEFTDSHPMPGSEHAEELLTEFAPTDSSGRPGPPEVDVGVLFDQLTAEVPEGRVLSSSLFTVLITDDGRVLAGAVPLETLRAMA